MLDPVLFPLFFAAFGQVAGGLLQSAAEKHVEKLFGRTLEKLAGYGKKDVWQQTMERALAAWAEMVLLNVQSSGLDEEELAEYRDALEQLLADELLAEALLKPVLDAEEREAPDALTLREAWKRVEGPAMPEGFRWQMVAAAYRKQVEKQKVLTPEVREVFGQQNIIAMREALRQLVGVVPQSNLLRYAERMRQKYGGLDLRDLRSPTTDDPGLLDLRNVFVPQNLREDPPELELPRDVIEQLGETGKANKQVADEHWHDEVARRKLERVRLSYSDRPRVPLLETLARPGNRHVVLLGGPGSGKSTLLRFLLLAVLEPAARDNAPTWVEAFAGHLPLLLELRDFFAQRIQGHCQNFLEYWHYLGKTQGYSIEQTWLDEQLKTGPGLVLFDGLDEIFDPAERERVRNEIAGFATEYPQARVVVTSRPVGYRDRELRAAGFKHFAIEELDRPQIERFVSGWFELVFPDDSNEAQVRGRRVLKAVEDSRPIRLLASNPMLLTIMTLIAQLRELPRERWRFYDFSAEVLCHHWDVNRHLEIAGLETDYFGLEDKKELLRRIAFTMQGVEGGLAGNFIGGDRLLEVIVGYLGERYGHPLDRSRSLAQAIVRQLRERNYILCLYGPHVYGFVHRTFLEYFCAAELARRLQQEPGYTIERLRDEVFAAHWRDTAWHEVLRLLCGLVGESYAATLIESLVADESLISPLVVNARPPRNVALAVRCLGEVRNLRAIEATALALLQGVTRLLERLREGPSQDLDKLLNEELLPSVREIGPVWPGAEWLKERFSRQLLAAAPSACAPYLLLVSRISASDESTRKELEQLAFLKLSIQMPWGIEDLRWSVRSAALSALASGWPEERTRELLRERALQDDHEYVRSAALSALASGWPEESSRELLRERALQDDNANVRRAALSALASGWLAPELRILLSRDLDGLEPFLDITEHMPKGHIEKAATRLGLATSTILQTLHEISEKFGFHLHEE